MMRIALISGAFVSLLFFPVSFSIVTAIAATVVAPLAPLALGIFVDLLYHAPHASPIPLYSVAGAIAALCSFVIRRFVETSIVSSD